MAESLEDHVEILSVCDQWVAYRRVTCERDKIGQTITGSDVFPGIYELASKHEAKAGPPFARYIEWRESDCDISCGVPLSQQIPQEGNIVVDRYTACKLAMLSFRGPYSDLGQAHEAVMNYIKAEGLQFGGPCWEVYDGPPNDDGIAMTHVCYPIVP